MLTKLLAQVPALDPDDAFIKSLTTMGAEACGQLRGLLRELVSHIGGDETLVHEVASVVQITCDTLMARAAPHPQPSDVPAHPPQHIDS